MSLSREELKAQYKHLILERNAGTEKELFSTRCSNFLSKNKISDCFTLLPITAAQRDFLDKTEGRKDVEFRHLAKVFGLFEKYAVNILDKPWHKELKTIKVYTGFFKYNFEQWLSLDTVYKIFNLIGYQKTPNHTLTIGTTDGERLLVIAFELYLAHNQLCTFKGNVDLCSKYSMQDIFEGWSNTTGNLNDIQEWLIRQIATKDEDHSYKTLYEHMRPVTVIDETMRFDENGQVMGVLIKYPPNCQKGGFGKSDQVKLQRLHDAKRNNRASGDYSSLTTANLSDDQLYGDGNPAVSPTNLTNGSNCSGDSTQASRLSTSVKRQLNIPDHELYGCEDHDVSSPTNVLNESDHLKRNEWRSWPSMPGNREQMLRNALNSNCGEQVVSRGGIGQRDSSHIYENIRRSVTSKHPLSTDVDHKIQGTERVLDLLASRIKHGEEKVGEQTGIEKSGQRFYGDPRASDEPDTERKVSSFDPCQLCHSTPYFRCTVCEQFVCQWCFEQKRHGCYRVSNV